MEASLGKSEAKVTVAEERIKKAKCSIQDQVKLAIVKAIEAF